MRHGRMERVFGTLQKWLPQELWLANIKTMAAANRFLKDQFVPDYNPRFAAPSLAAAWPRMKPWTSATSAGVGVRPLPIAHTGS
jgi:hypothetical protein